MNRRIVTLASVVGAGALGLAACGNDSRSGTTSADTASSSAQSTAATAPKSARVDLAAPSFSNPTVINNPRFPISELTQVIQLGREAGADLRTEVTLLPETKVVDVNGERIETRVSQFVAYEDGRILEIALDFFAQADDGAVWYFGEDVYNYVDGVVDNTEGTWLAGQDGPPGMIMPGDPQVGDVYRPENIPGFVFEEVTVKEVDKTVAGPTGPVEGAIVVQELLMDGLREDKTFAPGYGEFAFAVPEEKERVEMALAVPTDAQPGPVPVELATISADAAAAFDTAPSGDWNAASTRVASITAAAEAATNVPEVLGVQLQDAIDALDEAVTRRDVAATQQAAIDVGQASLDRQLQYRDPVDVDRDRLGIWNRQLALDEAAGARGLVAGDQVVLATIQARIS